MAISVMDLEKSAFLLVMNRSAPSVHCSGEVDGISRTQPAGRTESRRQLCRRLVRRKEGDPADGQTQGKQLLSGIVA